MDVYLVQHGAALPAEQDPRRPLSEAGRAAVAKVAACLAARGSLLVAPPIVEIRHSGKLRAQQTAEILGQALCPQLRPQAVDHLAPDDDPGALQSELESRRNEDTALMLVGHLPHLARLAGLLLAGDAARSPVRFANAAVLRLSFGRDGWAVDWYLPPACLP